MIDYKNNCERRDRRKRRFIKIVDVIVALSCAAGFIVLMGIAQTLVTYA